MIAKLDNVDTRFFYLLNILRRFIEFHLFITILDIRLWKLKLKILLKD